MQVTDDHGLQEDLYSCTTLCGSAPMLFGSTIHHQCCLAVQYCPGAAEYCSSSSVLCLPVPLLGTGSRATGMPT
jgi:hypothetical protein